MNETTVTVVGTVCSEVRYGQATGETPMARFQIRNTPRRYDKRTGTWGDGDPSYYSAICFRSLADHVASSMGVGDPVVATGRLRISRWRRGEEHMITAELDVQAIGHDLRWGTTVYRRATPPAHPRPRPCPPARRGGGSSDGRRRRGRCRDPHARVGAGRRRRSRRGSGQLDQRPDTGNGLGHRRGRNRAWPRGHKPPPPTRPDAATQAQPATTAATELPAAA